MAHGRIAPEGFDPWREAFRIVQAYETWQTFGDFITKQKPDIGPGVKERMQFASTVTKTQADASPRGCQQGARSYPADRRARHGPGAADRAQHCAEDRNVRPELEDFRTRVMRLTCTAGHFRPAADEHPRLRRSMAAR